MKTKPVENICLSPHGEVPGPEGSERVTGQSAGSRRALLKGAAWGAPVLAAAVAVPLTAASNLPADLTPADLTWWPQGVIAGPTDMRFDFSITNVGSGVADPAIKPITIFFYRPILGGTYTIDWANAMLPPGVTYTAASSTVTFTYSSTIPSGGSLFFSIPGRWVKSGNSGGLATGIVRIGSGSGGDDNIGNDVKSLGFSFS